MIFFFGASLFMVNLSAHAQTTYYTTAGVPESSTLTLRAWPSHASKPIANIPFNTTAIIPTGKNIMLHEDKWIQIGFEDKTGWVEATYVTKLAVQQQPTQATQQTQPVAAPQIQAASISAPTPTQAPAQQQFHPEPNHPPVPWSARADSIYLDPNAPAQQPQLPEVITTTHSVVVIPSKAEEIDLRSEDVTHSRYSSIDTAFSIRFDQH